MLPAAVVGCALAVALVVGDTAAFVAAGHRAATAADAAALAAAPLTFRPFGARREPVREARRLAAENGAELVSCRCPTDPSWRPRTVTIVVSVVVRLNVMGRRTVRAVGRAEYVPTARWSPFSPPTS